MADANTTTASGEQGQQGQVIHQVSRKSLPLSCPGPDAPVWSLHPKVYLPIKKTGKAVCPYCGARYELVD